MSLTRRSALALAAAAAAVFATVAPASAAIAPSARVHSATVHGAARSPEVVPSDCVVVSAGSIDPYMTCTARPAGQKWEFEALCWLNAYHAGTRYGNEVTGDGSSTITDCVAASQPNIYYPPS